MIIETERLILRPFTGADKAPYAQMGANALAMQFYHSLVSRRACDAKIDQFESLRLENGFHFLAAELKQDRHFIGILGLARIDAETKSAIPGHPEVEIGWVLHPDHWGRGLAPEGARACLAYAWNTLHLDEVVSFTSRRNKPSQRVMEKIGMTRRPEDDFEHPKIPVGHNLRPHVLYRIKSLN